MKLAEYMENLIVSVNNNDYEVHYQSDSHCCLIVGDKQFKIELLKKLNEDVYTFLVNQKVYQVEFYFSNQNLSISLNGFSYNIELKDSTRELLQKFLNNNKSGKSTGAGIVKAPMPGLVIKIFVEQGMQVLPGDKLLIVEAMKMENLLKSTIAGTVKEIRAKEGSAVDKDNVLLIIEPN